MGELGGLNFTGLLWVLLPGWHTLALWHLCMPQKGFANLLHECLERLLLCFHELRVSPPLLPVGNGHRYTGCLLQ